MSWQKVVFASDCEPCDCCEEPVCPICQLHYAECDCPGPHQEDEFEYVEEEGSLLARKL